MTAIVLWSERAFNGSEAAISIFDHGSLVLRRSYIVSMEVMDCVNSLLVEGLVVAHISIDLVLLVGMDGFLEMNSVALGTDILLLVFPERIDLLLAYSDALSSRVVHILFFLVILVLHQVVSIADMWLL